MLIGDSLAFSLGLGQMIEEHNYGVELANAAILGCAFHTGGELNVSGTWESPPAGCPGALSQWRRDERAFRPQAVIVELGYRDEFDWRSHGKVTHLGQPAFDAAVEAQIERYVQVLGGWPYADPVPVGPVRGPAAAARRIALPGRLSGAARADQLPAADGRRRRPVRGAGVEHRQRGLPWATSYQREVHGKLCRFDGIHFAIYCSELVAPEVLSSRRAE